MTDKLELLSIHIPKTAGSSLLDLIKINYGNEACKDYKREDVFVLQKKNKNLIDDLSIKIKAVHGHLYFKETLELVKKEKPKIITWFRDPINRVISNYAFFIKRLHDDPSTFNEAEFINQHRRNESILTYASHEENRNCMVQFIDGLELRDLFFFGFVETIENDIMELANLLSWQYCNIKKIKDNTQFKKQYINISVAEMERLKELNSLDIKLYNKALALKKLGFKKKITS